MMIDIPLEIISNVSVQARYDEHGDIYLYNVELRSECSCGALLAAKVSFTKAGILVISEPCIFCKED